MLKGRDFRWYAKGKMMSEVQYVLLILLYIYMGHGVNFTITVFKLTIFNYYFVFLNRQIHLKRLLTV
jgi:hypothetical protein